MKIDISNYCPKNDNQIGGTCYAYAVAYTAFSTQYNINNKITDKNIIEKDAFSYFFVASVVRYEFLPWRKRILDIHCSWLGTAEYSLTVLKDDGCTKKSEKDFMCQDGVRQNDLLIASKNKIKDFKEITSDFNTSDLSFNAIVNELKSLKPVITAIYSTDEFHEIDKGSTILTDYKVGSEANHVVCILGYDDTLFSNEGGFLIKNNYQGWGDGIGFCWIRCKDFMQLIDTSYTMTL